MAKASFLRLPLPHIALGALALSLALVGEARASEAPASEVPVYPPETCTQPESPDASRAAFVQGKAAYDQSNNNLAVAQLTLAYRLDCTRHTFLSFIAQVLERQTRFDEAVRALELYLQRAHELPAAERANVEAKVKNLRVLDNKKKLDQAAAADAVAKAKAGAPVPVREHTLPPWFVVGVGAAGVVTGVVLIAVAPALPATCDAKTRECSAAATQADRDQAGLSENLPLAGTLTIIGGGALIAGGLLWHFLEPTGPIKTAALPRVSPSLGAGYAGFAASGTF